LENNPGVYRAVCRLMRTTDLEKSFSAIRSVILPPLFVSLWIDCLGKRVFCLEETFIVALHIMSMGRVR